MPEPNQAIAEKIMASMTDEDWQVFNEIGEELAEDSKKAQVDGQETPEDSTEEKDSNETSQTEEKTPEPYISFNSQEEFQKAVDARLDERMKRLERKASDEKEKAERAARKKALEDQEKYQELYETETKRTAELEANLERLGELEEKNQAYASTLEAHAASRMEALNLKPGIKTLLSQMDVKERLDWLNENEADFASEATREPIPPSPTADPNGSTPEADQAARREATLQTIRSF